MNKKYIVNSILSLLFILTFVQANAQVINFNKLDSVLIKRANKYYYKSNNIEFSGKIKLVKENGIEYLHYKDGAHEVDSIFNKKLEAIIRYQNDFITDRFLFDKDGNKFQEEIYLDTSRTCKQIFWWHPNGRIWRIEAFTNKEKTGKWYEWFENGKLLFEGEFKNGEKIGTWVFYNAKTGKVIRKENY